MIASLYFLVRCLLDLTLVRRPALGPNLNLSGLAWLGGALFVSLVAVAVRQPVRPRPDEGQHHRSAPSASTPRRPSSPMRRSPPSASWRCCAISAWSSALVLSAGGTSRTSTRAWPPPPSTCSCLTPSCCCPTRPLRFSRWHHVWPMALVVWAVFTYRRPLLAGAFLGLAAGTTFFLVVTLPAWVSFYRGRGAGRFLLSFVVSAGLGLAVLGGILWLNGELPSSLQSDWTKFVWQPWKQPDPATPGFWQDMPSQSVARMPAAYRVPVFIASMALVAMSLVWPSPKNLAHVLALSAAMPDQHPVLVRRPGRRVRAVVSAAAAVAGVPPQPGVEHAADRRRPTTGWPASRSSPGPAGPAPLGRPHAAEKVVLNPSCRGSRRAGYNPRSSRGTGEIDLWSSTPHSGKADLCHVSKEARGCMKTLGRPSGCDRDRRVPRRPHRARGRRTHANAPISTSSATASSTAAPSRPCSDCSGRFTTSASAPSSTSARAFSPPTVAEEEYCSDEEIKFVRIRRCRGTACAATRRSMTASTASWR